MEFYAIGIVENGIEDLGKHGWDLVESKVVLDPKYRGGLAGLETFSHAEILFYLDRAEFHLEKDLIGRPRRRVENPLVGIFARRSNHRPNGIGLTVAKILEVGEDYLILQGLDAVHGTKILDIKPFTPKIKEREIHMPDWAK